LVASVALSTRGVSYYFFFQAEDGIRDFHVTGVQTCALPIFGHCILIRHSPFGFLVLAGFSHHFNAHDDRFLHRSYRPLLVHHPRSEERRVGKEGSSWRVAQLAKNNKVRYRPRSATFLMRETA